MTYIVPSVEEVRGKGELLDAIGSVAILFAVLFVGEVWVLRNSLATLMVASVPLVLSLTDIYLQSFTWVKIWMLSLGMLVVHFVPFFIPQNQEDSSTHHEKIERKPSPSPSLWRRVLRWMVPIMLGINIAGPAAFMVMTGRWVGGIVAVVLIAAMAGPSSVTSSDKGGLSYALRWEWVVCYTCWNFDFVAGSFPRHHWEHIAVLGVPLLVAWMGGRDPSLWMAARARTLTAYIMTLLIIQDFYEIDWLPSTLPFWTQQEIIATTQTLSLASALLLSFFSLIPQSTFITSTPNK